LNREGAKGDEKRMIIYRSLYFLRAFAPSRFNHFRAHWESFDDRRVRMAETDEATTRRETLVRHLEDTGALQDAAVREAMLAVPRHLFLPAEPLARAYEDDAIATKRTAAGVAISSASQPAMVAMMLEQLALAPGMRVLEIGAGTGYNASLLRTLVGETGHVTTIDIDEDITTAARAHLAAVGITDVTVITDDGAVGFAANAPYDRVILTVGAGGIAPAWVAQLAADGLLVLPLRVGAAQFSIAFARVGEALRSRSIISCGFMPLRGTMDESGATRVLASGLRMLTPSDVPIDRTRLENLFTTPPTERVIEGAGWGSFSALSLDGHAPVMLQSDDARYGFTGGAFAYIDATGTSACVVRAQAGGPYNPALVYGSPDAADELNRALADWQAEGAPTPQSYAITAIPEGDDTPVREGATTVQLLHWRLVITR